MNMKTKTENLQTNKYLCFGIRIMGTINKNSNALKVSFNQCAMLVVLSDVERRPCGLTNFLVFNNTFIVTKREHFTFCFYVFCKLTEFISYCINKSMFSIPKITRDLVQNVDDVA